MRDDVRRAYYLDFVDRSFRDSADGDYLGARVLHRHRLFAQFLWAAHQAVEKYLKAILLYHLSSARHLGHDLNAAFKRVCSIPDLPVAVPKDVPEFIGYLNQQGPNRYFEWGSYTLGHELLQLDRTVWHLRRYCRWMRDSGGHDAGRLQREVAAIETFPITQASRFRIEGGYLEKVLAEPRTALYRQLVWKNLWFGRRVRLKIKYRPTGFRAANPTHIVRPDVYSDLAKVVDFSKAIKDLFKARGVVSDGAVEQADAADEAQGGTRTAS